MYIPIFLEIDEEKKPIYQKEFEQSTMRGTVVLATKEYKALAPENERVKVIPDEIMDNLEKAVEEPCDRDILLMIQQNLALVQWITETVCHSNVDVEGLLCCGDYISVCEASKWIQVPLYIVKNQISRERHTTVNERMRELLQQEKEQLTQKDVLLEEKQNAIENLNAYIKSTENYMRELQLHATDLDNDLQKYKTLFEENGDQADRVEHLEQEIQHYIFLYKEAVEKLDKANVELLNLKQKSKGK